MNVIDATLSSEYPGSYNRYKELRLTGKLILNDSLYIDIDWLFHSWDVEFIYTEQLTIKTKTFESIIIMCQPTLFNLEIKHDDGTVTLIEKH